MKRYATTFIMNDKCSFGGAHSVAIGDGMLVSVGHEKIGFYHAKKTQFSDYTTAAHKIFKREVFDAVSEVELNKQNHAIGFALNAVSDGAPAILGETHTFEEKRVLKLVNSFPSVHEINPKEFKKHKLEYKQKNKVAQIGNVYNVCYSAVSKSPSFLFTLARFNNSLLRQDALDKHIDLAIALESILNSTQEISFKFALLNAAIYTDDFVKRKEIFGKLKNLYNIRSEIVHGAHDGKKYLSPSDFNLLINVCKISIIYKASCLAEGLSEKSWKKHQQDLMLGAKRREVT